MASDVDKEKQGGDSARSPRRSNSCTREHHRHVVDAAGESLSYHNSSDNESVGSRKSKTRYINSAICVETIEVSHSVVSLNDSNVGDPVSITPHPHTTYRSCSTPFLTERPCDGQSDCSYASGRITRKSCRLPLDSARKYNEDDEGNDKTYREDGHDTFRLSVASMSTTDTTKEEREQNEAKRRQAFKEWCTRKEEEKRERLRQERERQQQHRQPAVSSDQREESFRKWMERKISQTERRKAEEIMRKIRASEQAAEERRRKEREKEERLNGWIKKKEEETKEWKLRQERAQAVAAMAQEKRRIAGERAYRDWLKTSKNKPLPVPLNRGELSMRGSMSDMYINPVPWQPPI